jgi:HlyD family secretion protein
MRNILLAASVAILASMLQAGAADTPEPAAEKTAVLPAISVVAVSRAELVDRALASGLIGPVERVFVQPEIEGQKTESVLAEVGDRVEAGQVLARLSVQSLDLQNSQLAASRASALAAIAQAEAQVIEARAAFDEAKRVWDRTDKLRASGNASQAASDQAEAGATSAAARVTMAEQGLSASRAQVAVIDAQIADVALRVGRTEIVAPVAGIVIERNAQVGAIASAAGQPMFVIMRDGLLELRADVAEADLLRLRPGQAAMLSAVGLAGPVSGTVRLVEPQVDAATRLGAVRISVDASDHLRSGLFAEAEIVIDRREGLAVPVTAVAYDGSGASVLKVDAEGRVARTAVETGIRDGGLVEIVAGLSEDEQIVARAGAFVRDGDRITPVSLASE